MISDANILTTAPSASPEMVNVSSVQSSSIDVSWGEVLCPHRNGEITGYVIMYWKTRGEEGGGGGEQMSRQTQEEMIRVDGHTVTIDDLDPLTEYSVMVAGVNSAGTGQFSEPVTVITEGIIIKIIVHMIAIMTICCCTCRAKLWLTATRYLCTL